MKIQLSKDCAHSLLTVSPKNWKTKKAKLNIQWFISYRFYDARFPNPKQVMIKGMNAFKLLSERQNETQKLLSKEIESLNNGFNPFNKESAAKVELDQTLTFMQSLQEALNKVSVAPITKRDLITSLNKFESAIIALGWIELPISSVSRKHMRILLDKSSNSDDRFNRNRSNLMILLSVLCELELVEYNFVRDIKKRKVVKYLRQVLTDEERIIVNEYLLAEYPEFHRFLHIFFHSGARISELIRLKVSDVDLKNYRFKMIIKKGSSYREVWRTIKNIALPFWEELLKGSLESDYLFSIGLKPGPMEIQPYQINKRWYRLVKKKLNIKADFYSLKHLHTTEVVELMGSQEAAKHNGHSSIAMVSQVYDVRKKERDITGIANLENKFA